MSKQIQHIRESFFNTVFSLLGHIANCDGYINRDEIKRIEIYMEKMSLTEECKREAKHLFKEGTSPIFNMNQVLQEFSKNTTPNLIQILLVYLITMARTDGKLVKKEMQVVQKVAKELGYNSIVFDHLLKMISAQDEFASPSSQNNEKPVNEQPGSGFKSREPHYQQKREETKKQETKGEQFQSKQSTSKQSGSGESPFEKSKFEQSKAKWKTFFYDQLNSGNPALTEAYEALGVKAEMPEGEIKKAYQRLVSQFHPDKLVGQGMPPDFVAAATERFKKIQAAYEYIKKNRHINAVA